MQDLREQKDVGGLRVCRCRFKTVAYLRLIDSCITQLKAQGPSRTCNESQEEEEEVARPPEARVRASGFRIQVQGTEFRV